PAAILINNAVHGSGQSVARLLSPGNWKLVYFDGVSSLLLRRDQARPANIEALRQAGLDRIEASRKSYESQLGGFGFPAISPRLLGAGTVYLSLNEFEKAASCYRLLVLGAPRFSAGWHNLGVTEIQLERYDDAVAALEQASRLQPANALTWLWLSKAYEGADHGSAAKTAFERAEQLNPTLAENFKNSSEAAGQEKK
ncbi:MAG: tetratricopeptide repeat protein, partial [Verrucomicrobia bacterium]|nr:tetratricopeptide repeat protein [Verrucomicrobiota bacterium]